MDWTQAARQAQQDTMAAFAAEPERALSTLHGMAESRDGLSCVYEQDGRSILLDMPGAVGGSAKGPTPGFFGRAAIAGCLAIGVRMTALRHGVAIGSVRVRIAQDWDNRGLFGMAGAPPAPLDTRIEIEVDSNEPAARVENVIAEALASDPWLLALREPQRVSTTLTTRPLAP